MTSTAQPTPTTAGVTEAATALVNFAWSAVVTDCTESAEYLNELVDNLRVALSTAPAGDGVREELHSCVCLLEVMADSAKERGDDVEWSMMSVMARNGRTSLSAGDGVPGMVLDPTAVDVLAQAKASLGRAAAHRSVKDSRRDINDAAWRISTVIAMLSASTAGGGK